MFTERSIVNSRTLRNDTIEEFNVVGIHVRYYWLL